MELFHGPEQVHAQLVKDYEGQHYVIPNDMPKTDVTALCRLMLCAIVESKVRKMACPLELSVAYWMLLLDPRPFADPEKGAPGQALSAMQGRKLKEIAAKAKGEEPKRWGRSKTSGSNRPQDYGNTTGED